ncbi:site-specific DNA-methyltransferase [Brucellaceae bacterium D45D]
MVGSSEQAASVYKHETEAVQRPDVGVEAQFSNKKTPKTYRYDSSLAPELAWDENGERAFAEWLLALIADAADKSEATVFAQPQVWQGTEERFTSLSQCAARLRSLTKPFLNWAGKAERQQITVPTLPLFVHERHSTQAILDTLQSHKATGTNLDLFGDIDLDVADKLDAYEHKGPWTNRLVLGDSLQVMNSLLEYEGMGGQVQMIYFDPPYGIKYGSNFQPFVRKRDVKHGADDEMIREPEMVKAYRDTWELGLHSYLTYLRDRLTLARELLTPQGSIFVQISDENVHHVREVLEEVFGSENFCSQINFVKNSGQTTTLLSGNCDYVLWYAKDKNAAKYTQLYYDKTSGSKYADRYDGVEFEDGTRRSLTKEEKQDSSSLPVGTRLYTLQPAISHGYNKNTTVEYTLNGKSYHPGATRQWKYTVAGMDRLAAANRLVGLEKMIYYVRYLDDFPAYAMGNNWTDTQDRLSKLYVVQTVPKVIQRCMLMTTNPGDLVLDITCGSGSTAFVAEEWGRRWITCDTSRVPIALARQRLLTSTFPWYRLKEPVKGPAGGFVYERKQNRRGEEIGGLIPKVTLKSIANDEQPITVTLVDRPEANNKITRVCGPFTVEATVQSAMNMEEDAPANPQPAVRSSPRAYLDRMIEVLRQSKTLNLPGNITLELETVSPLADREYLHAEGVARNGTEKRIAIVFGPEDGAIGSEYVFNAHTEALQQGYSQLFLFGFAIDAKAREMLAKLKLSTTYVAVTPDVVMSDLLKTSKSSEIFSITGLPDVRLEEAGKDKDGTPLHRIVIKGLDIFRPDTMETDEVKAENLPCWMLDANYNGMAFFASQVFFPKTSAWDNLQKSLKGQFAESVWEHLAGTASEAFALGDKKRIAVKAIDERGNELMVVKSAGSSN